MQIVVGLGSQALLPHEEAVTARNLKDAVDRAAGVLSRALLEGDRLVITHGAGAHVGHSGPLAAPEEAQLDAAQLLELVRTATETWLGEHLELAIRNRLPPGALFARLVVQPVVEQGDAAFHHEGQPVGPVFSAESARHLSAGLSWHMRKMPDGGYRRLLPHPAPVDLIELGAIKRLAGGGVTLLCGLESEPVLRTEAGELDPDLEAVVDLDAATALLAARLEADFLVLLTGVGGVYADYGGPDQRLIATGGPKAMEAYLKALPEGTMRPKLAAAVHFVRETGRPAAIGRVEDFDDLLVGRKGTLIAPDGGALSFHDHLAPGGKSVRQG
jgi:carbamate kinase